MEGALTMVEEDADLVRRVGRRDAGAFRTLVERHYPAVHRFCSRLLRDETGAEDAAQDVFLRVHESAAAWEPRAAVLTWILQIARNACLNELKSRSRRLGWLQRLWSSRAPAPRAATERDARVDALKRAMGGLPERQRTALVLAVYERLSYAQIAEVMELTVPAVETLIVRARRQLRETLAEAGD